MSNTNSLEGIRCPKCGNEERLYISVEAIAVVTDDGSEVYGDHEWDEESAIECPDCRHCGKVKDFRILPPDPDGQNEDRAGRARHALAAFVAATGTDWEDALGDLLTNLMHWADRNNYDFDLALDRARGHYEAETGGEVA